MATPYSRAAGMPDYHGYFIPELWVPKMQLQFEKASTFMAISTTEYEGLIKNFGDTVNISVEPTVTIRDYVKGQKLIREALDPSLVTLEINQGKTYSIHVDDVDQKQSNIDLINEFAKSAGRRLQEDIDSTVLKGIYNSENSNNSGATAGADSGGFNLGSYSGSQVALTDTNIIDVITDVGTVLSEQSVPTENRWFILPPVFINLLFRSDLKDASFSGDNQSISINGKMPRKVAGFDIYESRQLYQITDTAESWYCLAGWKGALTFASQLINTRAIEAQDTFGHYIDGLHVFGYKVVRDEGLAVLYAKRG